MQRRRLHSKGIGARSPDHVELFNLRIPLLGLAHSALQTVVTYLISITAEEGYPGNGLYHYGAALTSSSQVIDWALRELALKSGVTLVSDSAPLTEKGD